jgi:hypothetical protein
METAKKVIQERIDILNQYLEKNKDSNDTAILMNIGNAMNTKELFERLKKSIEDKDIAEINILIPETIGKLIERNTDSLEKQTEEAIKIAITKYIEEYQQALGEIIELIRGKQEPVVETEYDLKVANKYQITYLVDVVSDNEEDYTFKEIVEAENEIKAVKKFAISETNPESSNVEWIKNIEGNLEEVLEQLMGAGYCITDIVDLNQINHYYKNDGEVSI